MTNISLVPKQKQWVCPLISLRSKIMTLVNWKIMFMINKTVPIVSYRMINISIGICRRQNSRHVLDMTEVSTHITGLSLFLLIIQTVIKAYFNKPSTFSYYIEFVQVVIFLYLVLTLPRALTSYWLTVRPWPPRRWFASSPESPPLWRWL